jgi:hypothetical protein
VGPIGQKALNKVVPHKKMQISITLLWRYYDATVTLPDAILVTFSSFFIVKSVGFERRHLTAVTSKKSVKTKTVMKMAIFRI